MFNFDWVVHVYDVIMPSRTPLELLKIMKVKPSDDMLEIGAGTGRITKHYGNLIKNLVLLDPSTKMLVKAKEKLPHAKLIRGVAENIPFPDNTFEKIIGYDSLHHWQDQIQGLKECFRVLKKEGELFLIEVDPNNFWGSKVILFEKIIRALYEKFGFAVEGTLHDYAFRGGHYVDAYLMARIRSEE